MFPLKGSDVAAEDKSPKALHATRTMVLGERELYDNPWLRVALADIRTPDGRRFESHVVRLPSVAVAAIVDSEDRVLMLWRHRFVNDQWGWELPGGIVEPGEGSLATAERETIEETGWRPNSLQPLFMFQPIPGTVDMPYSMFIAYGAEKVGEPTDAEEAGVVEWVPMADVLGLAERGELLGSGTLVALLYLVARRQGPGR